MGGATILRAGTNYYKTMLRTERAEIFGYVPPFLTFWGYINRKRGQQKISYKFVWSTWQFEGSCRRAPS